MSTDNTKVNPQNVNFIVFNLGNSGRSSSSPEQLLQSTMSQFFPNNLPQQQQQQQQSQGSQSSQNRVKQQKNSGDKKEEKHNNNSQKKQPENPIFFKGKFRAKIGKALYDLKAFTSKHAVPKEKVIEAVRRQSPSNFFNDPKSQSSKLTYNCKQAFKKLIEVKYVKKGVNGYYFTPEGKTEYEEKLKKWEKEDKKVSVKPAIDHPAIQQNILSMIKNNDNGKENNNKKKENNNEDKKKESVNENKDKEEEEEEEINISEPPNKRQKLQQDSSQIQSESQKCNLSSTKPSKPQSQSSSASSTKSIPKKSLTSPCKLTWTKMKFDNLKVLVSAHFKNKIGDNLGKSLSKQGIELKERIIAKEFCYFLTVTDKEYVVNLLIVVHINIHKDNTVTEYDNVDGTLEEARRKGFKKVLVIGTTEETRNKCRSYNFSFSKAVNADDVINAITNSAKKVFDIAKTSFDAVPYGEVRIK